ncbi:urease accessory protein UreF [Kumtagia ephedrae]|uniref:Urease accessory protein UreF n=1 Tax=Kumtagia ephedrae TaxID=2116701 RepID=A0A2P7S1T0_9HYPH|nr:urease accessory protein UreF [Mesorhizobium ephedrae]PSJ56411.1 urease accessory protein UreF [Mesorhizobium ephedrae]
MDTVTAMTDRPAGALLRLMAWLSPAFPVGSFSYSHGLERAVHDGLVADAESLRDWLETLLQCGSGWNDAVLFAEAWRLARKGGGLRDAADLAAALSGSRERHMESTLQGAAFLKAAEAWPVAGLSALPEDCAYCVAVGALAGAHGVPLADALGAFLQAFATNLVQAGIRLGVTGQQGAVALIAGLEPTVTEAAARAAVSSLGDLGACAMISDVAAMRHETQYSRLFRS